MANITTKEDAKIAILSSINHNVNKQVLDVDFSLYIQIYLDNDRYDFDKSLKDNIKMFLSYVGKKQAILY